MTESRIDYRNVIRIAGAYVAWVMGSGFATGQEILQFFTSYGYYSFILLGINLAGFLIIGPMILEAACAKRDNPGYNHLVYYSGRKLGWLYSWFLPISLFAGMIILISGSGATLEEYYGINHYVGALLMAVMALLAYFAGFQRFVRVVSFIGPVIILFSLIVGIVTVVRDADGLMRVNEFTEVMEAKQPVPLWWLSGLLYISYNLCGGSKYYSALGMTGTTPREARIGAVVGTFALMASILLMNSAMLTNIGECGRLDVPTLHLARIIADNGNILILQRHAVDCQRKVCEAGDGSGKTLCHWHLYCRIPAGAAAIFGTGRIRLHGSRIHRACICRMCCIQEI